MIRTLYITSVILSILLILVNLLFKLFHWSSGDLFYIIFLTILFVVLPLFFINKRMNRTQMFLKIDLGGMIILLILFIILLLYPKTNHISLENGTKLFETIEKNLDYKILILENETKNIEIDTFYLAELEKKKILILKNKTDSLCFKLDLFYKQVKNIEGNNSELINQIVFNGGLANSLKMEILKYQKYIIGNFDNNNLIIIQNDNLEYWEENKFGNLSKQVIMTTIKQLEFNIREIENKLIKNR